jgi:hypothetical protein
LASRPAKRSMLIGPMFMTSAAHRALGSQERKVIAVHLPMR